LTLGAKTATCAKLRGRYCSFIFLRGEKIATLEKLGVKTAIKPIIYGGSIPLFV